MTNFALAYTKKKKITFHDLGANDISFSDLKISASKLQLSIIHFSACPIPPTPTRSCISVSLSTYHPWFSSSQRLSSYSFFASLCNELPVHLFWFPPDIVSVCLSVSLSFCLSLSVTLTVSWSPICCSWQKLPPTVTKAVTTAWPTRNLGCQGWVPLGHITPI